MNKKPNVRRWRQPQAIQSQKDLDLLKLIATLELESRWNKNEALRFARTALVRAVKDAIRMEDYSVADNYAFWDGVELLGRKAQAALREFIEHVGPSGLPTAIYFPTLATLEGKSLKIGDVLRRADGTFVRREEAKQEIDLIVTAFEGLQKMSAQATRCVKRLKYSRVNDADHAKRMFVFRLAEAWVLLTGKKPGKSQYGPFARFVNAAVDDAGLDEEFFFDAIVWAVDQLQLSVGIKERGSGWGRS